MRSCIAGHVPASTSTSTSTLTTTTTTTTQDTRPQIWPNSTNCVSVFGPESDPHAGLNHFRPVASLTHVLDPRLADQPDQSNQNDAASLDEVKTVFTLLVQRMQPMNLAGQKELTMVRYGVYSGVHTQGTTKACRNSTVTRRLLPND